MPHIALYGSASQAEKAKPKIIVKYNINYKVNKVYKENSYVLQIKLYVYLGNKCRSALTSSERVGFSVLHFFNLSFARFHRILQITYTISLIYSTVQFKTPPSTSVGCRPEYDHY